MRNEMDEEKHRHSILSLAPSYGIRFMQRINFRMDKKVGEINSIIQEYGDNFIFSFRFGFS